MKRHVWIAIAALVLLAVAVTPVMAGGGKNQIRWLGNVFSLVGEVTELDEAAGTITVKVYNGNKLVQGYIGKELAVKTDEDTLFLQYGHEQGETITFAELEVGDYISINGHVVDGVFVAKRVTAGVPLDCQGCQK